MRTISILEAGFRDDLVEAHRAVAESACRPGTWWNGEERRAIAVETRTALGHRDLPPWEAPSQVDGLIADDHPLPAAAIDAIWRITNHPGTLTATWHAEIVAGLPSAEHYVELVALVAMVNSVDRFATVMDLVPVPLGEPASGEPSRERVDGAAVTTHWVPTAPITGANVLKALSAVPADRPTQLALSEAQYLPHDALLGDLDWGRPTLDRRQIELLAAQTSLLNECFY